MLYERVAATGHAVTEFSLTRALFGTWDVVHIHWPESVFNHTFLEAVPTTEALLFAVRQARRRGAKLMWTVHNLRAHERRHVSAESHFRKRFFAELDGLVTLSHSALQAAREMYPELGALPGWVVPHPHYRGQYPDQQLSRAEAQAALGLPDARPVLLCVGRVFDYKNFDQVLSAVRASSERWTVIVAGEPRDSRVAEQLRKAAGDDARLRLDLQFVAASDLQKYLRAAHLVLQPYREILNSGTALLALSFDRPILLPARGAARELQQAVPGAWVQSYEGELDVAAIATALERCADLPELTDAAHLAAFSPQAAGDAQVRAFEEVVRA